MATLANIFGEVPQICLKDEKGVYLDGKKIALDNASNNGYIRRNGTRTLTPLDGCTGMHDVELPLRFVGAAVGADAEMLEIAAIAAIGDAVNRVTSSEIDKLVIAESEGIATEELKKFTDVALVMIDFTQTFKKEYNPNCTYDIC